MITISKTTLAAHIITDIESQYWACWEGNESQVSYYQEKICSTVNALRPFCEISTDYCRDNGLVEGIVINGTKYSVDLDSLIAKYEKSK